MNRDFKLIIFLFSFMVFVSSCVGSKRMADRYYNEGLKSKKNGEYGSAVDSFKKVITTAPRTYKAKLALYELGEVYEETAETKKAIRVFEAYIKLTKPTGNKRFQVLNKIGDLYYFKSSDYEEALKYYFEANNYSSSQRDKFEVLLRIANTYYKLYKFKEAIEYFDRAAKTGDKIKDDKLIPKIQEAVYYTAFSYSVLSDQMSDTSKNYTRVDPIGPAKRTIEILDKCIQYDEDSKYGVLCRFEKADNLAQIDEKEKALDILMELRDLYPNRSVIESKISKLEEKK
jgi:tetratricopeptide (TPR) repeat protein